MKRELKLDQDFIEHLKGLAESMIDMGKIALESFDGDSIHDIINHANRLLSINEFCKFTNRLASLHITQGVHIAKGEIPNYDEEDNRWLTGNPHPIFEKTVKIKSQREQLAEYIKEIMGDE